MSGRPGTALPRDGDFEACGSPKRSDARRADRLCGRLPYDVRPVGHLLCGKLSDGGGSRRPDDNFAHDLKMARSSASSAWASADGTKLFRPGSGRLRFFAYAPHSSDTRLGGALNQLAKSEGGEPRIRYTVPAKPRSSSTS